jgi:predicted transcriptional regulator
MTESARVLINVRVKPEAKERLEILALKTELSLSDIARLALSRGLPILEKELHG